MMKKIYKHKVIFARKFIFKNFGRENSKFAKLNIFDFKSKNSVLKLDISRKFGAKIQTILANLIFWILLDFFCDFCPQ